MPISLCMSGMSIDGLARVRPDTIDTLVWRTANQNIGDWWWDQSEIVGSTQHASPLVQEELPILDSETPTHYWDSYSAGFVRLEIHWARKAAEHYFHRTPLGFCPSEKIYAPHADWIVEQTGHYYCIIGGEHFGDDFDAKWHKGQVFYADGNLKIIPTTNDIHICDFEKYKNSDDIINAAIDHARTYGTGRIVLSCDLNPFLGIGPGSVSLEEGEERIKWLYIRCRERSSEIRMVNTKAIADSTVVPGYHPAQNLYEFYHRNGKHRHYISSWGNAEGDMSWIDFKRARQAAEFIMSHTDKYFGGADGHKLQEAKEKWLNISGTPFYDNRWHWKKFMREYYKGELKEARNILNSA